MKPLSRIGPRERQVIQARRSAAARPLQQLAAVEGVLRRLLDMLLPDVAADIDLAAFVDEHTGHPLGRGDRPDGTPAEPQLFLAGLRALETVGFNGMATDEQSALIGRMRRGEADDELDVAAKLFVDRLLDKALIGYLAQPDTWQRIGFGGPAYPQGYAWIGTAGAASRHNRKPGWKAL